MNIFQFPGHEQQFDAADAEAEDGYGEPPAHIVVDARGLTPHRARLARHTAWIASAEADLARLAAGKIKLEADLSKAEDAKRQLAGLVSRDAASLVDCLKTGAEWALSQFGGQDVKDLASKLAASEHHAAIASLALKSTQDEIARVEGLRETLRSRKSSFVAAAAREAAQGVYDDFLAAQDNLRDAMTAIAGLDAALGNARQGRIVATVPDLVGLSGLAELPVVALKSEIDAARSVWRRFVDALSKDPRASADMITFKPHDPNATDNVAYHELHALERRVVDLQFAQKGPSICKCTP